MKRYALSIVLLLLCHSMLFAQKQYTIKGAVADTMATYKLVNTTLTVLHQKDSTLVKFIRADAGGRFEMSNLKPGKFILLATYPGYADYAEEFSLDSLHPLKDFGSINLILKSTLLADVIIKGKVAAIRIKGDTTEYNAGSYNITPNSKVEDLLKQLPGIQVDKNGKITAQGETVNKVLVDGEEFFGDDPTLVTKNLRGDMVDKVQLYDKKSDQATFTGIEDGEKTKTINIKLKEDKKNGYFGKVEAGGAEKFYQNQVMFNAFKGKKKVSGYGIFGNTGQTGLNWSDGDKYGGSGNMEVMADGGIMMYRDNDEFSSWDGRFNGEGIPTTNTGGVHFEDKWGNDKHALNTNYKIGQIGVEGTRNTQTLNNLPSGQLNSASDQNFDNKVFKQKLDATYTIQLDSSSNLRVRMDGSVNKSNTNDKYLSSSRREDNSLINTGDRRLTNDTEKQAFNFSAFYTKKLKKKGRTISLNISESINTSDGEGYLFSKNEFYNTSSQPDSTREVNQLKINNTSGQVFNSNLTYTEPLSKVSALILNYGLNLNNGSSDRRSFNQSGSGAYDQLDRQFSNDFELNQSSNRGGLTYNYNKDKTNISFGTNVTSVGFSQYDAYADKTYKRNFVNWNPQARYNYRFSQQKSFRISYYGYTNQPSIDQIQPVRVNNDPLNISLGNPDLKPSFNNSFNIGYNSYKILSEQSLWVSGSYSFTLNPITSNNLTDAAGKNTYQSINLSDKRPSNFYLNVSADRKIKALGLNLGFEGNFRGNINYNLSNEVLNSTQNFNYSGSLSISRYKENKYSFRISGGPSYNTVNSSLQNRSDNNAYGFQGNGDISVELPGKISVSTDGDYQYTGKTQTFDQELSRFIWNASISKKFFKADNLRLSLKGNDLLNQNVGFSRYPSGNMITQNSYTTIRRYFLLSAVWDFTKMGGAATK